MQTNGTIATEPHIPKMQDDPIKNRCGASEGICTFESTIHSELLP